jgi:predicted alpha/beta superfamily hydrolase
MKFLSVLICLVSLPLFADTSAQIDTDLLRNKALIGMLQDNPYGRQRIVKLLARGEEQTPLLVSMPQPTELKPYPVLYVVLDGDQRRVSALEAANTFSNQNVIYVGVPSSNRIRDYSSPLLQGEANNESLSEDTKKLLAKGPLKGDEFVTHLAKIVLPFLEKDYGPFSVKVLVGGSLGGITVLDTLLSFPDSFDAYGVLSPSLWYNYAYYEAKLETLSKHPEALRNKCMLMTSSEDEPLIAPNARKLDHFFAGLTFPQSFRYQYKRLTELQHSQAIMAATALVPPFVFNIDDIIPDDELKSLSLTQFQKKLAEALKSKTCLSFPTMDLTLPLYERFGAALVKEKRFDDAFATYEIARNGSPHRTMHLLSGDAFIWPAFDKLSKSQKDTLANDYVRSYDETLKTLPQALVHLTNPALAKYARENLH